MSFLYTLGIRIYAFLISIIALKNKKAKLFKQGRKNWEKPLREAFQNKRLEGQTVIWFHSASVGEFEQARPLIEQIRETYQDRVFLLLSFFSPSGYEHLKDYNQVDYVSYLPIDTPANAKKWLDIVQPEKVFFIKYEFWFNYLSALNKAQIPLFLVSGIFRPQQAFFKWYGFWQKQQLKAFTHFFLQNENSKQLLKSIGFSNTTVCGDTRVDRVLSIVNNKKEYPDIKQFKGNDLCLVVGSSWQEDEAFLLPFINANPQYKYIIAPHEINDKRINALKAQLNLPFQIWSGHQIEIQNNTKVLIINTVGHLSRLYRYADLAYVGGAFKTGLHNVLEPSVFGIPVLFGSIYHKFQEAKDLIHVGSAVSVTDEATLSKELYLLFENTEERQQRGQKALDYFEQSKGASQKILKQLEVIRG